RSSKDDGTAGEDSGTRGHESRCRNRSGRRESAPPTAGDRAVPVRESLCVWSSDPRPQRAYSPIISIDCSHRHPDEQHHFLPRRREAHEEENHFFFFVRSSWLRVFVSNDVADYRGAAESSERSHSGSCPHISRSTDSFM